MGNVEKILEKLLHGESDANLRFDELCQLLQAKGFRMARVRQPSHLHTPRSDGTHQPSARRLERETVSGSTDPENSGNLQTVMKPNSYEMVIWWSMEDGAYVVDVPELPGCMAHGKSRQTAIKNAESAIKFWNKTAREDGAAIPLPEGRLIFA
jgi:predicted RNase H-like HicB family nuclease